MSKLIPQSFRLIDSYQYRKQQHGLFKIVEYSSLRDGSNAKKRTIAKNLTLSEAEEYLYKVEKENAKRMKKNM